MKSALLLLAFIACAASKFEKQDPLEVFLSQLGQKWQQMTCQKVVQFQRSGPITQNAFRNCLQSTDQLTAETISDFRPIAQKVLDEAVSDLNHTYYQLDPDTNGWTIGGRPAPASVDGDKKNAEKLSVAFNSKFELLLRSKFGKGPEGHLSKRNPSTLRQAWMETETGLHRRRFGNLFRSVPKVLTSGISNAAMRVTGGASKVAGSVASDAGSVGV